MFNCGREVRLSECGLLAHHQLLGEFAAAPGSHLLVFQPSAAAGHQPSWAESVRGLGCEQPHVARHQLVPGNMLDSVAIIHHPGPGGAGECPGVPLRAVRVPAQQLRLPHSQPRHPGR